MDMLELSIRAACVGKANFSPFIIQGSFSDEELRQLREFVEARCGAYVDSMFNTWIFYGYPEDSWYMMKRATWDSPRGFESFEEMLNQLKLYYSGKSWE